MPSIGATAKIEATECSGFLIFKSCRMVKVDAVADESGNLYEPAKCYEHVSDYNYKNNQCWISFESGSLRSPDLRHKNDAGEYETIDAEYLTFSCIKS